MHRHLKMRRPDPHKQLYVAEEHVSDKALTYAELSTLHSPSWTSAAADVNTLMEELAARGWHPTDILDAVDEARRVQKHGA